METQNLDFVWVVKASERNDELKHSIRSVAANCKFRNIVVCGYKPKWLNEKVIHIPRVKVRGTSKYYDSAFNLIAACNSPLVSEDFVLMNDDFFIMHPMKYLPVYYRDDLERVIQLYEKSFGKTGPYLAGMKTTLDLLDDKYHIDSPLSYELHVPFIYNKQKRLELQDIQMPYLLSSKSLHTRTLYGNLYKLGGEKLRDCKITNRQQRWDKKQMFLSTEERTFNGLLVGRYIQNTFNKKCQFER